MRILTIGLILFIVSCGPTAAVVVKRNETGASVTWEAGADQARALRTECGRQQRQTDYVRWTASGGVGLSALATGAAAAQRDISVAWAGTGIAAASLVALVVAEIMDVNRSRLCDLTRMQGASTPAADAPSQGAASDLFGP